MKQYMQHCIRLQAMLVAMYPRILYLLTLQFDTYIQDNKGNTAAK